MMTIQLPSPPPQPLRRSPRLSHKSAKHPPTALNIKTTALVPRDPTNTDDERRSLSPTPLLYDRKKRSRNTSGRLGSKKRKLSLDKAVDISDHARPCITSDSRSEGVSGSLRPIQEPQGSTSASVLQGADPSAVPTTELVESHEASSSVHNLPQSIPNDSLTLKDQPNTEEQDFTPAWNSTILDASNFQSLPTVVDSDTTGVYPTAAAAAAVNDQLQQQPTQVPSSYVMLAPLPSPTFPATSSSLCHALSYADPSQDDPAALPIHHQPQQDISDNFSLAHRTLCLARRALWAVITKTPWIPSDTDQLSTPLDPDRIFAAAERNQVLIPTTEDAINAAKEAERAARQRQQRELRSLRQYSASLSSVGNGNNWSSSSSSSSSFAGWKRSPVEIRDAPIWKALCCAKVGEIVETTRPQTIRSLMELEHREFFSLREPDNWYLRCVPPGELPLQDGAILPSTFSSSSSSSSSSFSSAFPFDAHSPVDVLMMDHEEGDIHDFEFYPFELDSDEDADADGETVTEESDCEEYESIKDENILCPGEERLDFGDINPSSSGDSSSSSISFNTLSPSSSNPSSSSNAATMMLMMDTSTTTINNNTLLKKTLPSLSSIPLSAIPLSVFHMLLFAFSSGEASEIIPRGTPIDYARKHDWWMAGSHPRHSTSTSIPVNVDALPFDSHWSTPDPSPIPGPGPMDWDNILGVGVVDPNGHGSASGTEDMPGYSLH